VTSITAVRSAFPSHRYSQEELTSAVAGLAPGLRDEPLNPARRALLERLHRNAGVRTRHTVLPVGDYSGFADGPGESNDRYITEATGLGARALESALSSAGAAAGDVDLLVVTSVTGVAVPSLDARLIPRLGLRPDVKRLPVFGLGCVAGAAGLARVHDYLRGWPGHTAALLSVELCSLTWRSDADSTADLVASGLFGDGAAAVIARGSPPGPPGASGPPGAAEILGTRSEVYPDSGDTLGWRLGSDGFRIVLTADLADVVSRHLAGTVTSFLSSHGLTVGDISAWICHPGGPKVLDAVQDCLKLPASALAVSRASLAAVGNLSSASVLHILEQTLDAQVEPGSHALMIGLGPGVSAELVLLRC